MAEPRYAHLRRALEGLVGQSLLEWRNGYGDSGSFHCGDFVPERNDSTRRERGSWVITIWAASVSLTIRHTSSDSRRHPPLSLEDLRLDRFTGMPVEDASVREDGSVVLQFGSSTRVEIELDNEAGPDEDQWTFETNGLGTFVMRRGPTLTLE